MAPRHLFCSSVCTRAPPGTQVHLISSAPTGEFRLSTTLLLFAADKDSCVTMKSRLTSGHVPLGRAWSALHAVVTVIKCGRGTGASSWQGVDGLPVSPPPGWQLLDLSLLGAQTNCFLGALVAGRPQKQVPRCVPLDLLLCPWLPRGKGSASSFLHCEAAALPFVLEKNLVAGYFEMMSRSHFPRETFPREFSWWFLTASPLSAFGSWHSRVWRNFPLDLVSVHVLNTGVLFSGWHRFLSLVILMPEVSQTWEWHPSGCSVFF